MIRLVARASALIAVSLATLVGLRALGLLDTQRVATAFQSHADLLALTVLCVLATSAIAVIRNRWALSVLELPLPWNRVASANLIGQAVGQWSGSVAIMELLRIGLLFDAKEHAAGRAKAVTRIALASLVDRVLGIGVMFCVGSVAALGAALRAQPGERALLFATAFVTAAIGAGLVTLPLAGNTRLLARLTDSLRAQGTHRWWGPVAVRLVGSLEHLRGASSLWAARPGAYAVTASLAVAASILNALSVYLASLAVGDEVPFLVILAVLPTTIVGIIVPTGFAGFGGPQLVSAALFAPFGVSAETVLATTLVQNTLALAVQTFLGTAWALVRGKSALSTMAGVSASLRDDAS